MTTLKLWRQSLQLSQPQMARYVSVSVNTWRKWEQGQTRPPAAAESLFSLLQLLHENPSPCNVIIDLMLIDARARTRSRRTAPPYQ